MVLREWCMRGMNKTLKQDTRQPYRQYYLSIDFDLRAIKSRSKAVNTLIFLASMIKLPAPAIEFSSKGHKIPCLLFLVEKFKATGCIHGTVLFS